MAVDVCSASEPFISPRISFSHDLNNQSSQSATNIATAAAPSAVTTFDFCITLNLVPPTTSADELFLDGVLLPTQIKNPETLCPKPKAMVSENEVMDVVHRKRLKELLSNNDEEQEKSSSRSFWKFTRTTSLNSGNGGGPKRLLRSLSLKRLLQNNSTPNPKGNEELKVIEKSNSRKEPSVLPSCSSSIQTPRVLNSCDGNHSWRRRLVAKKYSSDGLQNNHVLNISSAYNMNLFGYASLLCKGKSKNKTK